LELYREKLLPEKVFVHTDKDIYAAGETLWGAIYLVDGQTHMTSNFSAHVYIELIDQKDSIVQSLKVLMTELSEPISLELPRKLKDGNHLLIAYTNYQRNTGNNTIFRKKIHIVNRKEDTNYANDSAERDPPSTIATLDQVKLKFFPEGGDCVTDIPCRVAIVSQTTSNYPINTQGKVFDNSGEYVGLFMTNQQGMGSFYYTPSTNAPYTARVDNQQTDYNLPAALESAYSLQVQRKNKGVQLLIQTNKDIGLEGSTIAVHHRGMLLLEEKIEISQTKTIIPLDPADLLPGVYVATLFEVKGSPVAERLFFIAPTEKSTALDLYLSKEDIQTRDSLEIVIDHRDIENLTYLDETESLISLSVVPSFALNASNSDIRSWILLNSDLDVPIQDAKDIIFQDNETARDHLIDQFLMTRAWRRFSWKEVTDSSLLSTPYKLEKGLSITGQLHKREKENKPLEGKVFLNQLGSGLFDETITDESGEFTFGPYVFYDTTKFAIQGRIHKRKNRKKATSDITVEDGSLLDVLIKDTSSPKISPTPIQEYIPLSVNLRAYDELSKEVQKYDPDFYDLSIQLDEVSITAERITQREKERQSRIAHVGKPSHRLDLIEDELLSNLTDIAQLFQLLPGVIVRRNGLNFQVFYRNAPVGVFIIDGNQTDPENIQSFSPREIEFIDLLRDTDAFRYRGASVAIAIYLKQGADAYADETPAKGISITEVIGYHLAKEFASLQLPRDSRSLLPDIRTTLHWNPKIRISTYDEAQEKISLSDQTGSFTIVAQGISEAGLPLFGSMEFEVKQSN